MALYFLDFPFPGRDTLALAAGRRVAPSDKVLPSDKVGSFG